MRVFCVCVCLFFLYSSLWTGCGGALQLEPLAEGGELGGSIEISVDGGTDGPPLEMAADGGVDGKLEDGALPELPVEEPVERASSICETKEDEISCPRQKATLRAGVILKVPRDVYWQVPKGTPPEGGWPVALMFQGSLFPSSLNWWGQKGLPFGAYHQANTLKHLLDNGYAVLTPLAHARGTTFWDTNVPPFSVSWENAPDHRFMLAIFEAMEKGTFGPVNPKKMFALGISSGGYMSSRMAVAYPGRFLALAIHSASYASCSGPLCVIPALPSDHPPTLFLHGSKDLIVPISTAQAYDKKLKEAGIQTSFVTDPEAAHEWIKAAPESVITWFNRFR